MDMESKRNILKDSESSSRTNVAATSQQRIFGNLGIFLKNKNKFL